MPTAQSIETKPVTRTPAYWETASPAERTPTRVFARAKEVSATVAREIADLIRAKAAKGERCVLGLATGSTPTGVYDELVRLHREEGLSFKNVVTFNLDEYWPMQPHELQSYHRFMREHLFDRIDIDPANTHIPDGTSSEDEVRAMCDGYERMIRAAGGVDLQLLGIGRTGHIGFNEPGSSRSSRTRLITLDRVTRKDAASDFFGEENVPTRAVTMGVGTILEAKRVVMMAFGEGKAPVVARAIEGAVTNSVAASFLQEHANAQVYLDLAAAAELERCKAPWASANHTGSHDLEWDDALTRKAVIWLARTTKKAILKLTAEDYNEHHLQDLLAGRGKAYDLNISVFRDLQRSITGWPGGKPESRKQAGDIDRPGDEIFPKRVLVFSPHPDDDVISMGGTLIRLVDQGHEVHVAYQTSGNIAVFDAEALRFLDFASDFNGMFGFEGAKTERMEHDIARTLKAKKPGEVDPPEVQRLKALIRRGEAKAAGIYCGVPEERLHFLDMPFYETGRVRKKPLSAEDIEIVKSLLRRVKPHLVYAAGDLSDPHGTHRVCLSAIFRALRECAAEPADQPWMKQCTTWLYRGAWQEWDVEQTEMAVPLSPDEVARKRAAIFKHQSQKDRALFPGADEREFWQRAEQRNAQTAKLYDQLGLQEYEAIEAFVRWDGRPLD
ncbi:MAG: glucosamine-6-phosphate deaminase [Phycisphaera sp.]|nr:glucosamine-6-phosphate deaminase [Phycisphaera sp.]